MLLATPTQKEQLKELERILASHLECWSREKVKKQFLFRNKVNYLGYEVSGNGIRMRQEYVDKILHWPTPTNGKQFKVY